MTVELELVADAELHLRCPSLANARSWELALRQSC